MRRAVDLYVDDELMAWFYRSDAPDASIRLKFEPGREGVWLEKTAIPNTAQISDWHTPVLRAWLDGKDTVRHFRPPGAPKI